MLPVGVHGGLWCSLKFAADSLPFGAKQAFYFVFLEVMFFELPTHKCHSRFTQYRKIYMFITATGIVVRVFLSN